MVDTRAHSAGVYRRRRIVVGLISGLLVVLIGVVGYAVWQVVRLGTGIQRSDILSGKTDGGGATGEEINLLLMGLDSRLDMNGKALSADLYEKLHSGDASDGGMNANVLMYVHIPADGSKAVAFSIPRDDYVDLPGCPDDICKGKIKEAYGLTFDQESRRLVQKGVKGDELHQRSRDAARKAQIETVEKFLGVKINHFVEVTMIAFFEIADVVQPITVCVKQPTVDTYSGADFVAGPQQINAEQAVAFVRQRRDTSNPSLMFTDLDRSRRQQAFIVSLLTQLKSSSTFTNPSKISGIIDVAKQNTAIDSGLDPLTLAKTASAMQGGKLNFYTLPIEEFGTTPGGASVNIVDVQWSRTSSTRPRPVLRRRRAPSLRLRRRRRSMGPVCASTPSTPRGVPERRGNSSMAWSPRASRRASREMAPLRGIPRSRMRRAPRRRVSGSPPISAVSRLGRRWAWPRAR